MNRMSFPAVLLHLVLATTPHAFSGAPTEPTARIALPEVEGRIDHMAVDMKGQRLFVAALGNNTVEVIDLTARKRVHSIPGLREPQGIACLAASDRIVVASGGDGTCRIFDGRTYRQTATISCGDDADNVRYDAEARRLYVGYGKGGLAVIDPAQGKRVADIPLDGHPESFQMESRGKRIFVNVPTARQIKVVDREKRVVVATWPVDQAEQNFPMALDEAHHRLLVGCRKPARLLVVDTESGKPVASLPCVGDTDDLFCDAKSRRVYVSGGEGAISVFDQTDADHYRPMATMRTAPGARTSLFVPASGCLYLAVPHRGGQKAEIWVYKM